ncbi:hypothetical protein [Staphylococcus agnetis]|uniref:hypothetical protein n=1 Tax=Staphylococcus agnetis TaxID=985762 RepID=UPI00117F55DE|nr:hypothetical protein [Staphylococcus agnetis]MBY7665062.1 hypothetical protein [Staphylococcus agnetis]TRW80161.1 hypothetical protein FNK43_09500 [Staphylococcus agnetis]
MELKHFVVQVNEDVYLKRGALNMGWFPTHDINDATKFMSRYNAQVIANDWGGKLIHYFVEIRT